MYSSDRTFGSLENYRNSRLIPAKVNFTSHYDADTFSIYEVSSSNQRFLQGRSKVRFLGIDAPETSHSTDKKSQYYGEKSKTILREIIPSNNQVYLRLPGQVSKDRVMGEVFIKDSEGKLISVNQELVKKGAAYLYDYFKDSSISEEVEKEYYNRVEKALQSPESEGLFSEKALMPSDFRLIEKGKMSSFLPPKALDRLKPELARYKDRQVFNKISKEYGITNQQLTPFFNPNSEVTYTLPSQYGSAYFFRRAIYAAQRDNAGLFTFDITETEGPATAAYKLTYIAQNAGETTDTVPWYIANYDREMATPGLSYYVNKWAIANGWGRIYKEEVGPLASLAGALGKVLDNSLVYYGGSLPDYIRRMQEIDPVGTYVEPPEGFFQATLSFATNFAVQTTQAVLGYFLIGVPIGIATAEIFKASYQSLVDIALQQGTVGKSKVAGIRAAQMVATGLTLGWEHASKDPTTLREFLWVNQNNLKEKVFRPGFNSFISGVNLMQNTKAAINFDYTIRPFVEDIVNPYRPDSSQYKFLQNALTNYRNTTSANIFGEFDSKDKKTAKFILQNDGFEKAKKVAEALDELGSYLPFNPLKWGRMGKNYDSVTLTLDAGGKIIAKDFLAMNEVFNFTGLLHTLERLYYGGEFLTIVNKGTYLNLNTDDPLGNIIAKNKSSFAVPKTLLGKAFNIVGAGIQRILNLDGVGGILKEHRKLLLLEEELLNKSIHWDGKSQNRLLASNNVEDVEKFIKGLLDYEVTLEGNNKLGITRDAMIEDAAKFYDQQNFPQAHLRNPNKLITNNKFINNRSNLGIYAIAILGASLILEDTMKATTGASLITQLILAWHHRNDNFSPDFEPTRVFGWGGGYTSIAASLGWSAFSLVVGAGVGSITTLKSPNLDRYILGTNAPEALIKIKSDPNISTLQKTILTKIIKGNTLLSVRPKGNFLPMMVWTTTAMLAARAIAPWVVSNAFKVFQSIPWLGEAVLGKKGNALLNENIGVMGELISVKRELIGRLKSGNITPLEAAGLYQLSFITSSMPIVDPKIKDKDTRVVAHQAPTPYFQFFATEVTKGRQYDEMGNLVRGGTLEFKAGMQTAPILGVNISFLFPVMIDMEKPNHLGFKGSLVHNNGKDNILSFLGAIGSIGSSLIVLTASMLTTISLMEGFFKLPLINLLNKDGILTSELKATSNIVKSIFKMSYGLFQDLVSFPVYSANLVAGGIKFNTTILQEIGLTVKNTANIIKGGTTILGRLGRSFGVSALLFAPLVTAGAKFLGADDQTQTAVYVGTTFAGTAAFSLYTNRLDGLDIPGKLKPITTKLASVVENITITPKRNLGYILTVGAFFAYGWLLTDSTFGVSINMDKDTYLTTDDDNKPLEKERNNWLKKSITMIGFTALSIPALEIADIGKSPAQILKEYTAGTEYLARARNYLNPLDYLRSPYVTFKNWLQRDYINWYLEKTLGYKSTLPQGYVTPTELAKANLATDHIDDAVNKINSIKLSAIDTIVSDTNLNKGLQALWSRADFINMKGGKSISAVRAGRLTTLVVATGLVSNAAYKLMQGWGYAASGGGTGQKATDAFYDSLDGNTFGEGLANIFRLVTRQDKRNSSSPIDTKIFVDDKGMQISRKGFRLLNPNDPQQQKVTKILQDIMAPFVVDPQNPFQSIGPGIGITLSSGDKGIKYRIYGQVQSQLQDTSFSIISMLPNYFFRLGMTPNSQYNFLVLEGMKKAIRDTKKSDTKTKSMATILAITSATAQLSPLAKPRKYSTPYIDPTLELASGDSILSHVLQLRIRRSNELAYQRPDNILSRSTDPFDINTLTELSNVVDIRNPLAAFPNDPRNPLQKATLEAMGNKQLAKLLRAVFATNNRLHVTDLEITKTEYKELEISPTVIDNPGEMLAYGGSLQLDNSNMKSEPWWGILWKGAESAWKMTEVFPTMIRFGAIGAVALTGVVLGAGFLGALAFSPMETRFEEATYRFRNMFATVGEEGAAKVYNFHAHRRITVDGNRMGVQIKGKGGRQFAVILPEGIDLTAKSEVQAVNEILQHVQISISNAHEEVVNRVFKISGDMFSDVNSPNPNQPNWVGSNRFKYVSETLRPQIISMVDDYVDSVFEAFITRQPGSNLSFGDLLTDRFQSKLLEPIDETVKGKLKNELYQAVDQFLAEEIHKSKELGEDILAKVEGARGQQLSKLLAHKIRSVVDTFASRLDNNLLYLESEDALGYGARVKNAILEMVEPFKFVQGHRNFFSRHNQLSTPRSATVSLPDGSSQPSAQLLDHLDRMQVPKLRRTTMLAGGLENTLKGFAILSSGMESLDIFTSFNRLAALESDPYATEGEINFAAESTGQTVFSSLIGSVVNITILSKLPNFFMKILPSLGKSALQSAARKPGKTGLTAILILGTIAAITAGGKAIGEAWNDVKNTSVVRSITGGISRIYEGTTNFFGQTLLSFDRFVNSVPVLKELTSPGSIIMFTGVGLATFLAATVASVTLAPALLLGLAAGSVASLAHSMFPGISRWTNGLLTPFMDWVSNIPHVGGFFATNSQGPLAFTKFYDDKAPIYVATAQMAIAHDSSKYLEASGDWTGNRTKGLFDNPTFYGNPYGELEPKARMFSKPTFTLVNSLIDREATIRSQYYNQVVVGAASWDKLIQSAENYKELKAITVQLRMGDPAIQQKLSSADASRQSELTALQQNTKDRLSNKQSNSQIKANLAALAKNFNNTVVKSNTNLKTKVQVNASEVKNTFIDTQANQVALQYNSQPVLVKSVKGEQVSNKVVITNKIAENNNLQLAVTRGMVNSYNSKPGYNI